jgi:hypothetical protein
MSLHAKRIFDAEVCVEKVIWLPGLAAQPSDDFRDFIEEELTDAHDVQKALPWLCGCAAECDNDLEEIGSAFVRKNLTGFLVRLSTPVPREFHPDGKSYSYSWGWTQLCWFYFDTFDALVERAEAWRNEVVDAARGAAKKSKRA